MIIQWLDDITSRIPELPTWWLAGIPRYCEYHPTRFFTYYAQALVRARCVGCYQEFDVAWSVDSVSAEIPTDREILTAINNHYERPPWHDRATTGFTCAGNHAGLELWEILQVWRREGAEWVRREHLEGEAGDF